MTSESSSKNHVAFVDLERELGVTRTLLERLPEEHYGWKPHEKSMTLGRLASHVADLPGWMRVTIAEDELDFATSPRPPQPPTTREELLARFDKNAAAAREAVARFDPASLRREWTLRNGQQVLTTRPKDYVYRVWCMNHLIHHRAQLCLYLRLLNVPVPTVYFNTADDPSWVFA
jgi:uncharacterized damage-inducible protein DinB